MSTSGKHRVNDAAAPSYRGAVTSLDAASALALSDPSAAVDSLPWLAAALADDRDAGRFSTWGLSTVIDENVGSAVLARPLFDELHRRAGLTARWPVGNAGLLHVYGYLLSSTPTPYGLKRERWLSGELERACGLDDGALLPWSGSATLLSRATEVAASVLARTDALVEAIDGRSVRIAIDQRHPDGVAALAYAVDDRIVTLFPVADPAALRAGLGAPRLRWNAV